MRNTTLRQMEQNPVLKEDYQDFLDGFLHPLRDREELTSFIQLLDSENALSIEKNIFQYLEPTARVSHVGLNFIEDMTLITFILQDDGNEEYETYYTVDEDGFYTLETPYWFSYTYNMQIPEFSELGDVFVNLRNNRFRRVG